MYHIRKACQEDVPALLAIYNYEVVHGTATLDLAPRTLAEWEQWFQDHTGSHVIYIAESDDEILGYASLSEYRTKEAFKSTVELSVYVHQEHRGVGVASALLEQVIKTAQNDPRIHTIVSVITSGNEASVHLHHKFGFTYSGTIHEVGMKFGRYQDIDNFEMHV